MRLLAFLMALVATNAYAQDQANKLTDEAVNAVGLLVKNLASNDSSEIIVGAVPKRFMGDAFPMLGVAGYRAADEKHERLIFVPCAGDPMEVAEDELEDVEERCSHRDETPTFILVQYGKFSVAMDAPVFAEGRQWQGAVVNIDAAAMEGAWNKDDVTKWINSAVEGARALGDESTQGATAFVVEASVVGSENYLVVRPITENATLADWTTSMTSNDLFTVDR